MAEFEEKLNQILSSPQAMEQIMSLANSLSGSGQQEPSPPEGTEQENLPDQPSPNPLGDLSSMMDPKLVSNVMSLLSVYQQNEDEKTQLLKAMRPFLRQERQEKLDQAIRITRISRVIRSAIAMFRGDGDV